MTHDDLPWPTLADDEADEARRDEQARRRASACRCGPGLPGFCPGPAACPVACDDCNDEEESDE